jgi:hypothetical protein
VKKFTLYPIYRLADEVDGEPFDGSQFPLLVVDGVNIEDVSPLRPGTFDIMKERLGTDVVEKLEQVRCVIIHRYEPSGSAIRLQVTEHEERQHSEALVRNIAACLRLIRPMRQNALLMHGNIREDLTLDVTSSDIPPLHTIEVPEVQKTFHLRNSDCESLRTHAGEFLRGMKGSFWKFRMSVQFHELGHFQTLDWKARFLLWCSAIESIYTTHNPDHQGKRVATSRIKAFLGETRSIYDPGDISDLLSDPHITVGQVVGDLYDVRNYLAHGDRIPDVFFQQQVRNGFNGPVMKMEMLLEAASFIVRASLLKIVRDRLLDHFRDAAAAEAYFGPALTNSGLRGVRP